MSHFYGTLQGARGRATRCGTKNSGMTTETASWEGAVRVEVYHDELSDSDRARVSLIPWRGAGVHADLFDGPIGGEHKE